uniref:227 kDa spindle-and centromere-associated protein n=2 Tax=Ascaris suum TaxID=6253 RepID=F1KQ60_ASCSU
MASLQRKVEEYRRRIADIESQIASQRSDERVTFNITEVGGETWTPEVRGLGAEYELASRLDDERRKNEELRLMNAQLHSEIQRLQQQYDFNLKEKERSYQIRERNLAQYLSEEQKKMMDLWAELQLVRRQCAEFKDQTERDLENQRNEFVKVMRNVGGVARQLNLSVFEDSTTEGGTVINQDTVLMEALKRFREQQTIPAGASIEDYNALMKKYEEAIERIVELESRGDGSAGKLAALEAELKRTRQRLAESQEVLHKLHTLAKESVRSETVKRTRSLSPSGHVIPSEVLRSVRHAIRTRDNELQQLQRKLKNAELQISEMVTRFESAEETRRRLEKQLADAKRDINIQAKSVEDATREIRRLEERLRASEVEKNVAESSRKKLEEEIRRLRVIIDQTDVDGLRKALDDAEAQKRHIEDEYKTRIMELTRRIDTLVDDNKRLKGDLTGVKDKYRNLEIEYTSTLRKIDEKDQALRNLDELRQDLLKDLENQRARFDALTSEFDHLQANFDSTSRSTVSIEMTVKEIKQQRDEISKQRDDLARQLTDVMHKLEIEIKKREDIEKANLLHIGEIEKLKAQITEYESQVMMLRRHNDELDTQLKTTMAKITTLENSLTSAQNEITKLSELNSKLQKEKNEIMSLKQKSDMEVDALKERVRKLEKEMEKIESENRTLRESEEKARQAYKEEVNKVHQLERELQEAKAEIDELRRRLAALDQENKERLESALRGRGGDKSDIYESTQITEIRVKELGDKHRLDLERLENERDELARRVQLLEDELAEKQRIIDRQKTDIEDLKRQYQAEIDRLKAELVNLETKYQNELEDERDQHQHEIEALKAAEDDLRNKISLLEKKLEEALNREKNLEKEILDWEEKYETLNKELQRVRDELEIVRIDAEKEIQRWKTEAYAAQTEVKNLEGANEALRSQLAAANDRANSLNKTINEQASRMRELSSHIRRLEEELAEAKAAAATFEADLQGALSRLNAVEQQYTSEQLENNKLRSEIDSLKRQIDVLKNTIVSDESEIDRLKKKVVYLTDTTKQQAEEIDKLRVERDQLDKSYREKVKLVDQLNETVKTLETKITRMRQEIQELSDKLVASETERNVLRAEIKKLEQELQFGREQMMRKTDEFHAALDELGHAHRVSEDGRVNALQELETRKFEISDLQSRLENTEQRLMTLQEEYLKVDRERDTLNDALRRFHSVISRSVIVDGQVDLQSIDVYVQKLMSRVEMIERERNDYRDSLDRLKRKTTDHITVNKHETLYKSIEERLSDIEEEKRKTEVKLASAKELLKSQEEALKQRDEERRTMKSKITAFELETRGKEAQIRHLNELVKKLQTEVETAQADIRTLREREEEWDLKKLHLESRAPVDDGEARVKMLMASFETERQSLNDSVRKLSSQLQISESKNADLRDAADRLKRDLVRAEKVEVELRRSLEEQTRIARECQQLRDQLNIAHSDLTAANSRKQQLENELMSVRSELRDHKQHLLDASNRISDLQRQLQDANSNKNRLSDKINELERTIATQRTTESDLRNQLSAAISERKTLQNELDDLRRRISQLEADKSVTHKRVEELKRIRITLIKKIEILETEKRSAEAVISETSAQREAIERSLNALERENKELCRNCAQLQQQIAQLEMDNGNRLIALTNKQKEEHDRFVQSVKAEKAQVERIIENRDRAQKNRIKQLEAQLSILREQLNNERLRRRDATERIYLSDMSKIGSSVFGMSNSGVVSAGPAIYPRADSLDYLIGGQNAFSSSYYTSPFNDIYRTSSTNLSLKDGEKVQESYTSSYRTSGISGLVTQTGGAAGHLSESASRYEPSVEVGDTEIKKKTTIIVQTRSARSGLDD